MEKNDSVLSELSPKALFGLINEIISDPKKIMEISFTRYLIIGFSTFFINFIMLFVLTNKFNLSGESWKTFALASIIPTTYNFIMSNYYTFTGGGKNKVKKLTKYIPLVIMNFAIGIIVPPKLVQFFGISPGMALVIITGVIVCWNFLLYKLWIFKDTKD